jgi:hypothetical protein
MIGQAGADMAESNMVHRIRLRGPWQLQAAAPGSAVSRSIPLPARIGAFSEAGARSVRLSRRFNRPTNLASTDRISLVIDRLPEGAQVTLNGTRLERESRAAGEPSVFPTSRLQLHNLLTIEFEVASIPAAGDEVWGDVALAIFSL